MDDPCQMPLPPLDTSLKSYLGSPGNPYPRRWIDLINLQSYLADIHLFDRSTQTGASSLAT